MAAEGRHPRPGRAAHHSLPAAAGALQLLAWRCSAVEMLPAVAALARQMAPTLVNSLDDPERAAHLGSVLGIPVRRGGRRGGRCCASASCGAQGSRSAGAAVVASGRPRLPPVRCAWQLRLPVGDCVAFPCIPCIAGRGRRPAGPVLASYHPCGAPPALAAHSLSCLVCSGSRAGPNRPWLPALQALPGLLPSVAMWLRRAPGMPCQPSQAAAPRHCCRGRERW